MLSEVREWVNEALRKGGGGEDVREIMKLYVRIIMIIRNDKECLNGGKRCKLLRCKLMAWSKGNIMIK